MQIFAVKHHSEADSLENDQHKLGVDYRSALARSALVEAALRDRHLNSFFKYNITAVIRCFPSRLRKTVVPLDIRLVSNSGSPRGIPTILDRVKSVCDGECVCEKERERE